TLTQTKDKLDKYYGDSAPSISMVKKWFTEFCCGRTSTSDAERSGCPIGVTTSETTEKIHDMVFHDRRLKVREIVEATGISHGSVVSILSDHLGMRKLSARWMPRLLTIDNKRNRVTISKECLALFNRNSNEFLRRFITVDETWIHHNTPETKEQSKQWISS
ncbi:Histone-lysine N-methyltransferase SETMAR, partial [Camponotus floridanus]